MTSQAALPPKTPPPDWPPPRARRPLRPLRVLTCRLLVPGEHLALALVADFDAAGLHEAGLAVDLHGHGRARRHRDGLAPRHAEAAAAGVQDGQVEVVDGDELQEAVVHLPIMRRVSNHDNHDYHESLMTIHDQSG